VVVDKTATTSALLDAIRERAAAGPVFVRVLVPDPAPARLPPATRAGRDQMLAQGERALALALPLIQAAGNCPTDGCVSPRRDPMDAIEEALYEADFDEIILSTPAPGFTHWLHMDLPSRVAHLGLPLTTIPVPRAAEAKDRRPPAVQATFRLRSPS
jgi:hypothetical protein